MKKVSYRTKDGALAFVFSYADTITPKYFSVTMKKRGVGPGMGPRRIVSPLLPKRLTEKDAQRDLDNYARIHGWKPAYVN